MDRQYVGIDFHRRRSVIVRVSAAGEKLSGVRLANDPVAIAVAVAEAGPEPGARSPEWSSRPPTAGTGWWICCGPAAPASIWRTRRASTGGSGGSRTTSATPSTWRTCCAWAACRRRGSLRPRCRLRELVRYRAKLVGLRSGLKAQVHAVMAKEGVQYALGL
jgi:hypothetical protein